MKNLVVLGAFAALVLVGGVGVAQAEETTTTTSSSKLTQIQELMKLIADLQAKLAAARGEVEELSKDLTVGAESEDVKKIQELLASDPTLFGAKPTGYFGPLTEAALKKFQERYGLEVTGKLDEATRTVMKELRAERKDGRVPPGLVKSDEVKDRIKARLKDKWKDCDFEIKFRAAVCEKVKDDMDDDEDDSDDSDDSSDDDSTDATKEEAKAAINAAQDDLAEFRITIDDMERVDRKEAFDTLREAQKKLMEARKKLGRGEFDDAVEKAEEAASIVAGDDSDDSSDDEDDDEDDEDDEDEDEDDDSDDDDEDEDEDDDEDDD